MIPDEAGMNIADFLEARITEDEARAASARDSAECDARRIITELHGPVEDRGWQSGVDHDFLWCGSCGTLDDAPVPFPCETLEALASAYKDHPDYQQEWAL